MSETVFDKIEEKKLAKWVNNPVNFATHVLDMEPRDYQKLMLKSSSKKRIVRSGRRVGKTATMIMHMLWYATTHKASRQLIVAPRGAQVDAIFEEVRNHINDSDLLQSSVKHSKQYPQTIELQNGSIIKGFSAGTSSGGKGNSIRGQGADWIYIDESDFLGPEDLNAIMGVQIEDIGNIGIWAASTPSGAKKLFYKWCVNSSVKYTVDNYEDLNLVKKVRKNGNGWVQFHFPSMVLPSWDEKLEAEMRSLFTEEGYIREVLAEFGEQEGGVYNNDYIEIAKNTGYTYKDMKGRDLPIDNPRIIGVDWDKATNPTNIIIMEFIPEIKKLAVVAREQISPGEFTYDNAVSKIVKLYKRWACDYVYADEGHGEYQVEMLKKKLGRNTVRGFAFNQKIEVMDPVDKKKVKKELKHFMVTETTIMLERKQLAFPSDDEDLIRNFQNYEIVRYTRSGKPIYTDKDEHAHDAVTLAVYGFNKEYPDITKLIERARYAKSVKEVNKKINEVQDIGKIFGDSSFDDEEDSEEESDNYVRHMKAIERANDKIGDRGGFQSWGGRGYSSGPPGRSKL